MADKSDLSPVTFVLLVIDREISLSRAVVEGGMWKSILAALGLAGWLWTGLGQPAFAQSAAPFGFWATESGETLLVTQGGSCSLALNGSITTAGRCTWESSYAGGILTIYSNGPVYFNVIWVNQNTIRVWGDLFIRRQ
jgi:hypothetical protein